MPTVRITDDLKEAIRDMPEREKDKLLLRLVAKDDLLVEKLTHQLLEDEVDVEFRREALKEKIQRYFDGDYGYWRHTPGLIMMDMRRLSGLITRHVKVTKDRYGEVELQTLLVSVVYRKQSPLLYHNQHKADKFALYACKKAQSIIKKLEKMDPDYFMEFQKSINEMLDHLRYFPPTARLMQHENLPQQWEY